MAACVTKDFLGVALLKPASGTIVAIPTVRATPRNPYNNSYPAVVNKSGFPSINVMGKRTPGVSIVSPGKNSWLTASLVNDLMLTRDADNNTKSFDVGIWEPSTGILRVWHSARCAALSLGQGPTGEVGVEMMFLSTHGNNEGAGGGDGWANPFSSITTYTVGAWPTGTCTLGSPAVTDAGAATGIIDTDFGSLPTLDMVRSWRLSLMCGQGHIHFIDGTRYPYCVASAMFGGTFVVEQSPLASTFVAKETNGSISVRLNTNSSNRFAFALQVYLDDERRDHEVGFGSIVKAYSLVDLSTGGNPATVTGY